MPLLVAAIPALVAAGSAIYSARQSSKNADKALNAQKDIASKLKYEPIDIAQLKAEATENAIANATKSLAIERQLTPDIASTRAELSRQVNSELALNGKLNTDTLNEVNMAGRVIGARSGIGSGSTVPLTAALLGVNSMAIGDKRRGAASALLDRNPLPYAGLDPGALASYEVANNAAYNQFNLEKSGVASNLVNSEAAARAAQIGGQTGMVSSLANLLGKGAGLYANSQPPVKSGGTAAYDDMISAMNNAPYNTNPLYTPVR